MANPLWERFRQPIVGDLIKQKLNQEMAQAYSGPQPSPVPGMLWDTLKNIAEGKYLKENINSLNDIGMRMAQGDVNAGLDMLSRFGGIGGVTKAKLDDLEKYFNNLGIESKVIDSTRSSSKYLELMSKDGELFKIRFADHPESGKALSLHGPSDFNVGGYEYADSNKISDAIKAALAKLTGRE